MDGLLLIDKPVDWTSHDVVAKLRGILKERRIGHAGTLDPFATGLLLLGIGKGTKALHTLTGAHKTYLATITLGATSTTFDPEGDITQTPSPIPPSRETLEKALDTFRGGYAQRAPLFSAKKRAGTPLYTLARKGLATEEMRPVKDVLIDKIEVRSFEWPLVELEISCGSGTYIRSLGDDLGHVLGVGAYVSTLRRTHIGPYDIGRAVSFDPIPSPELIQGAILPLPSP